MFDSHKYTAADEDEFFERSWWAEFFLSSVVMLTRSKLSR